MGGRRKQAEGRGCEEWMVTTFHEVAEGVDREERGGVGSGWLQLLILFPPQGILSEFSHF